MLRTDIYRVCLFAQAKGVCSRDNSRQKQGVTFGSSLPSSDCNSVLRRYHRVLIDTGEGKWSTQDKAKKNVFTWKKYILQNIAKIVIKHQLSWLPAMFGIVVEISSKQYYSFLISFYQFRHECLLVEIIHCIFAVTLHSIQKCCKKLVFVFDFVFDEHQKCGHSHHTFDFIFDVRQRWGENYQHIWRNLWRASMCSKSSFSSRARWFE